VQAAIALLANVAPKDRLLAPTGAMAFNVYFIKVINVAILNGRANLAP